MNNSTKIILVDGPSKGQKKEALFGIYGEPFPNTLNILVEKNTGYDFSIINPEYIIRNCWKHNSFEYIEEEIPKFYYYIQYKAELKNPWIRRRKYYYAGAYAPKIINCIQHTFHMLPGKEIAIPTSTECSLKEYA